MTKRSRSIKTGQSEQAVNYTIRTEPGQRASLFGTTPNCTDHDKTCIPKHCGYVPPLMSICTSNPPPDSLTHIHSYVSYHSQQWPEIDNLRVCERNTCVLVADIEGITLFWKTNSKRLHPPETYPTKIIRPATKARLTFFSLLTNSRDRNQSEYYTCRICVTLWDKPS